MKHLFFMISATNSKMGSFIRTVSHCPYNHVSFSFYEDLHDMVSFARYYYHTPFFGGYVHEGRQRYDRATKIKLYKVPVHDDQYQKIIQIIQDMDTHPKKYAYHMPDAIVSPLKIHLHADHAYTCLSFTVTLLKETDLPVSDIQSINELISHLQHYEIYSGLLPLHQLADEQDYMTKISFSDSLTWTLKQNYSLLQSCHFKRNRQND